MSKTFHRDNCKSCVRNVETLRDGHIKIIVTGQHAFEWSVTLMTDDNCTTVRFENRTLALKEAQRLKTMYKPKEKRRIH